MWRPHVAPTIGMLTLSLGGAEAGCMILIRHGATEWNKHARLMSRTDLALSDAGVAQVDEACAVIARLEPSTLVTSPSLRCRQTAERLSTAFGLPSATVWDELVEVDFGAFEGLTPREAEAGPLALEYSQWRDRS